MGYRLPKHILDAMKSGGAVQQANRISTSTRLFQLEPEVRDNIQELCSKHFDPSAHIETDEVDGE